MFRLNWSFVEVNYEGLQAEQVALKQASNQEMTLDRNHLIGMLIGVFVGIVCTVIVVFLVIRFCHPIRQQFSTRTRHQHRLRLHQDPRGIHLESHLRDSLINNHPLYANPSPFERSVHSTSSPRYNFLLHSPSPLNVERSSEYVPPSVEATSTTTGFYDRLSDNTNNIK